MTSDPIARYLSHRTAKMDRRNRLRVMSGSEVIDVAIRVYQMLGWTFLKLTVVPSLFCLAAVSFFFIYVWPSYFVTNKPGSFTGQLSEMVYTTGLALFVAAPLFVLGISYTSVIVTQLTSDYMVGNVPDGNAAEARARFLLPKLFWLNLREILLACSGILGALVILAFAGYLGTGNVTAQNDATAGVVVLLAFVGFAAGGVVFLFVVSRHSLAPVILTLENTSMKEAAKRSGYLLKTHGFHGNGTGSIFGLHLLMFCLWLLIGGGISMSFELMGIDSAIRGGLSMLPYPSFFAQALALLPSFLALWTIAPVWAAATTIIYYDRRIRLEGYDIEALAEDVWRADRSRRFDL